MKPQMGGIVRWLASVGLVVLIVPSASADWLHEGYDVGRSGATTARAPDWPDLAYTLELGGISPSLDAPLVVVDGKAYVETQDAKGHAIFEIDIESADVRVLRRFDWKGDTGFASTDDVKAMESDGKRLYAVKSGRTVFAIDLKSGAVEWLTYLVVPMEINYGTMSREDCYLRAQLLVDKDSVFVACEVAIQSTVLLWRLRAEDGQPVWPNPVVVRSHHDSFSNPSPSSRAAASALPRNGLTIFPAGLTAAGDSIVVAVFAHLHPGEGRTLRGTLGMASYHAFDLDGELLWSHAGHIARGATEVTGPEPPHEPPPAAANDEFVMLELDSFLRRNHQNRGRDADKEFDRYAEANATDLGSGFALAPEGVYLTSRSTLFLVTPDLRPKANWTLPSGMEFARGPLTRTSDGALLVRYGGITDDFDHDTVQAVEAGTLRPLWRHELPPNNFARTDMWYRATPLVVVDDKVLLWTTDGFFQVLGRTEASLQPKVGLSTLFPVVGAVVEADLSGTRAGRFGAPAEYMAMWGDGTSSAWQSSPKLAHRYAAPIQAQARFLVRNADLTQSASVDVLVQVEAPDPAGLAATVPGGADAAPRTDLLGNWPILLEIALPLVGATGLGAALVRRRPRDATKARLETYNAVLLEEIAAGTKPAKRLEKLRPLRASLGVTDQEHEILEVAAAQGTTPSFGQQRVGASFLGRYRVLKALGEGGFGRAHVCFDELVERKVVIKTLRAAETAGLDSLLVEARALGRLQHPNVVTLLDADRIGSEVFLVMELLEGGPLSDRLRRHHGPGEAWINLAEDVLSGIEAIHDAGLLHRDIKPSNVLSTKAGRWKVADFGVAHLPGLEGTVHAFNGTVGTVRYMSPEQARGRSLTGASDLYSAALLLYEAWTGHPYYEEAPRESGLELQMRIAKSGPFSREMDATQEMLAWWTKALDPTAAGRFQSAKEMRTALRKALRPHARPTEPRVPMQTKRLPTTGARPRRQGHLVRPEPASRDPPTVRIRGEAMLGSVADAARP